MLKDLTIRSKLTGSFGVILTLSSLVGFFGYQGVNKLDTRIIKADDVNRLVKDILDARIEEKNYILRGDPVYAKKVSDKIQGIRAQIQETRSRFLMKEDVEQIEKVKSIVDQYDDAFQSYVRLEDQKKSALKEMREAGQNALNQAESIRSDQKSQLKKIQSDRDTFLDDRLSKADDSNRMFKILFKGNMFREQLLQKNDPKIFKKWQALNSELIMLAKDLRERFTQGYHLKLADEIIERGENYKVTFSRYLKSKNSESKKKSLVLQEEIEKRIDSLRKDQKEQLSEAMASSKSKVVDKLTKADDANRIIKLFLNVRKDEKNFVVSRDHDDYKSALEGLKNIVDLSADLKSRFKLAFDLAQIDDVVESISRYKKDLEDYVSLIEAQKDSEEAMLQAARESRQANETARATQKARMTKDIDEANFSVVTASLSAIALGLWLAFIISRGISRPVGQALAVSDSLALGDTSINIDIESRDETGKLLESMQKMVVSVSEVADVCAAVADGDLNRETVIRSEKDQLGLAVNKMVTQLRSAEVEGEKRDWTKTRQTDLANRLRNAKELKPMIDSILEFLGEYLNAQVSSLYLRNEDIFELAGNYCFNDESLKKDSFLLGEGLVGQVAKSKKELLLSNVSEGSSNLNIKTGIGTISPEHLLISPLICENEVLGVLSLGSTEEFSERQLELLKLSAEGIAISLNSARSQLQLQEVLKLTQEKSRTAKVFMDATDPIIIEDLDAVILDLNHEAVRAYGYSREELIKKSIKTLVPEDKHNQADKILELSRAGKEIRNVEGIRLAKDGTQIPVLLTLSQLKDEEGKTIATATIAKDITEQKKIEAELEAEKKNLETKIEERTKELKIAQDEAVGANKSKGDFLANMSHEIRTPMNAIIGMSNLAMNTELTAKQHNYISKIQISSQALLGLINDILDFSKIEAGKMDVENIHFHLDEVLDHLATLVTMKAQEKGLEVLFSISRAVPRNLLGDPLRLGQVLTNLANNAVKFTEQGEIIVSIKCLKDEDNHAELEFSVKDTGIGLSQEQIGKLFQSFSQADSSTTRKYGGTGLGLTISKSLVEIMGGKIRVESEVGQGSKFIFTAIFEKDVQRSETILCVSENLSGKRVLIVDDNETARDVLNHALKGLSFDVSSASSGSEAITMVEDADADADNPFEFIVMDWQMPEMNGIRTSEIIKKHKRLKHIPKIIMLTAYGREEVSSEAEAVGIDAFLVKPMNTSVLFDTIMEVFGEKVESRKPQTLLQGDTKEDIAALAEIHGAKILLAEDNEINQEIAIELLESVGLNVTVANNGREAVELVNQSKFDCILMDMQMPEMDGYEATQELRKDKRYKELPIIAMTANAMQGDREKCLKAGMNDYISKPINPKDLYSTLVKWIPEQESSGGETSAPPVTEIKQNGNEFTSIAGINVEEGLGRVNGNKDLFTKMLTKFYQDNLNIKSEIQKAVDDGEIKLAERMVHTVKGVSATIGAKKVAEASEPIETGLRKGKKKINKKLFKEFSKSLDEVLEALKEIIPQNGNAKNQQVDFSKITLEQTLIDSIKEDIQAGLLMELDEYFSQIETMGTEGQRLAGHLKELANQFDDQEILKVLDGLEHVN
jgi:two-component system sensor histidine kinase/response regulator